MSAKPVGLAGSTRIHQDLTVVTVSGEIDLATVGRFQSLIDEGVSSGAQHVAIDLAGVDFCDAQGLTVLARAATQLQAEGRRLSVIAVPPKVYRLFQLTGLVERLSVQRPATDAALVQGLLRSRALPHVHDILDASLKLVVTMAQAVVAGADGVSITLPRKGVLLTVAASNAVVLDMDHDQYDTGEGPCLDAATQGHPFHIDSLDEEVRWPRFVPLARARGIQSIMSTPLPGEASPLGAMNVYSREIGAFAVHEKEWAEQFATEAAVVVATALREQATASLDGQLQHALRSREVIAMAQGATMLRDDLSQHEAYIRLVGVSRDTGIPLYDVCQQLLADLPGTSWAEGEAHGRAR